MGRQAHKRRARRERAAPEDVPSAVAAAPRRAPWRPVVVLGVVLGGLAVIAVGLGVGLGRLACGGAAPARRALMLDAGVSAGVEHEPNDAPEMAQAIDRLPAQVAAEWQVGDRDRFSVVVDAPGGQLLDAWTEGRSGLRLCVSRDGVEKACAVAPARVGALGVARGGYLLSVEGQEAKAGAYQLHVRRTPWVTGLEWEPDDTPDTAQELARAKPAPAAPPEQSEREIARYHGAGWWSRPGDVDCFVVPLEVPPAGAVIRLELTPPLAVRARLWVLDAGDHEVGVAPRKLAEAAGAAPGEQVVIPALGARSWEARYTACAAGVGGEDAERRYSLDVRSFTPAGPFEFEPNDDAARATALPRGTALTAYLPSSDVDWYRISAAPEPAVRVVVELPAGTGADVVLRDEQGRELGRARSARGGERLALDATGGVFAEVRAGSAAAVEKTYRITSTSAPTETKLP